MKKLTLFLVAMLAMVNVANAQRAWAYDLELTPSGDSYTFAFKAVTAGDATLVFYKEGVEAGTLNLGSVSAGDNTVTKTSEELLGAIQQSGDFTWGVKMSAGAIAAGSTLKEVTDQTRGIYDFYNMMDVLVDNNPESDYFGKIYIQMALNGKSDGATTRSDNQKAGLFIYDQELNELNPTSNVGIKPTLPSPSGYTLGDDRNKFHRLEIDPKTGNLAYCYNVSGSPAVFSIDRANPTGLVTNLIDGISGFTQTCALCFDAEGTLYVMDLASSKGTIYKVVDGQKTAFSETTGKWVNASMSLASDGRGGLWVSQNRGQIDTYYQLVHYNASGTVDFSIYDDLGTYVAATKDNPGKLGTSSLGWLGSSSRGALAYDAERHILAQGRNGAVELFNVTYNASGVPTLTKFAVTPSVGNNIDGLHFDYAGDLYVVNSSKEKFQKFEVPTDNNTCTTPAKKAQMITLVSATQEYTVTINKIGEGEVTGASTGTYLEGSVLTLTATPAEHYTFTGWTGNVTSTDIPLTVTVDGDKTITANFVKNNYTLTVNVNDDTKGSVNLTSGTYEAEKEVEITATANTGYEFVGWSNGSKENPLTISMEEDTELTANFRAILPSSITLNAHPVKDYSASIVGTMKRAIQYGENTIVLTHEDNGTPHIYNIAHTTKTVTEISQEGVVAVDPDNAGDFLAISDIALTADGKLVACNYMLCQNTASYVDAGYKRGTTRFYIWNEIDGDPTLWFTSQQSVNYYRARVGYTMALKGTSDDAWVIVAGFNNNATGPARFDHYHLVNGSKSTTSPSKAANMSYSAIGSTYEISASPLADGNWVLDGELAVPTEFVESKDNQEMTIFTPIAESVLGKKYNGATYLANYNDHHLMIAPYAGADGKLAGVKVLGISDGFDAATLVTTATDLTTAIDATTAAATAYVDGDGDLTIYLIADGKVYPFSEKAYTAQTFTITAIAGEGGTVEGGGLYEESSTATVTATPNEHYDFVSWTEDGEVVSTTAEYSFTVTKDIELTANFQEHTKYTITAHAADNTMGYVTGGKAYYAGETVTLKAVANSTYYFVNWSDGVTDAIRTFTATADVTLTANFAKATPRAWAYDLKMVEDGDNYKFSFTATTAANATLLFLDKEGNELYAAHNMGAVAAGANTVSIEKAYFTQVKDVYWSVKMDGEAITAVAEITDQSRGIYDFYSTLGVVVDNNPESEYFGKIYVQATLNGDSDGKTPRAQKQKAGLFIYDQKLDELNPTPNTGIQPSLPSGYSIGDTYQFNRLAIDPITNNITYCYAISGQPAVFSMDRADLTGTPANLLAGQSGITRSVAHCFDTDGALYVMDLPGSGTIYKIKDGVKTQLTETTNKFVNPNITMTSDGRGGLWVSQNRGQMDGSPYYYQLAHVTSAGAIDWAVNQQTPHGFEGASSRGALAYDTERQILAQGRNGKVELYSVSYEPTIELTPLHTVASDYLGNNIDGLAFDFAGDLYVVNSSKEKFQKFTLPTAENICTVSAPESQVIIKEVRYTVTVNTVGNGTAIGAGEYVAGETATFEASPAANHQFVNWTYESETSTDNPLELVVNSDITVTANFAPVQYTLIAPTNDENKGIVTGAGTYNYGTEVTLTATPKAGYKLLYWSDRSTENPRTITMTKNEAISAYFVKEYDEEPTFKIEKIWENTQVPGSADGYQAVGWDGNIYMQNKTAGKIKVYTNDTDAAVDYATSNTSGQQIAVDEAGNLIVFNAYFASATPNAIQIYQKGSTTAKAINFTLPNPGRCDFLSASGDIYSAEGGYVYFYCQSTTVVNRVKIANGELVSVDVVGNNITAGNSQNHVMVDIFGNLVAHSRTAVINATINVHTNESMPFALIDHKYSTLGGCTFELGGKELWAYNVGTTHYNSEWNLYNMTDKEFVSDETLYAKDKVSKKEKGAANWLNVQVVDENTAYIYQFCPEVAVAVWKVSIEVPKYTRTVTNGDYGTICLPYGSSNYNGAEFYEIAYLELEADGTTPKGIWLDEVTELEAGKPYIFKATADELVVYYEGEEKLIPVAGKAGLTGTFTNITDESVLEGNYMIAHNKFWLCGTGCWLNANRAYIEHDALHGSTTPISPMPGRRRVYMGGAGENSATGTEDMIVPNKQVQKIIENGQLIIIRDGVKYNVQGVRL